MLPAIFTFAAEKDTLRHEQGDQLYKLIQSFYLKNTDSMRYYIREAEPVFLREGRMEDVFRVKAWLIYALTSSREDQEVMTQVNALKELARKHDFPEGMDMANQALADFYIETGFVKMGIELYEEVLRGMEERGAPLVKRVHIIRQLLNKGTLTETRKFYLEKLASYIRDCEQAGVTQIGPEVSLLYVKYLYHRSYTQLGVDIHDLGMTATHLREVKRLIKEKELSGEEMSVLNLEFLYNVQAKNYDEALSIADRLIHFAKEKKRVTSLLMLMQEKADIYFQTGQGMESAKLYREYVSLKDSVTTATLYDDLAKLKTRHDVDKLELKNKQMALEAVQSRAQMVILWSGLAFLVLLCCSLGYISYSRHRYGRQLEKAKERAEEADRLKSAFLANMNHEIRTPLNAIVGFSQVLVEEDDKETRQQLADIIQNNNELLQRLIVDVLDLSKIESNSMDLIYKEQDIPSLMNEIHSIILLRMPENVELKLDKCPPLTMNTDRNRLTQILTNLLTNAVKHTTDGYVRFGYKLADGQVEFFVQDSGEGIPDDQLERIFSRFVQLDSWKKGVGLGLAICKGLIEKMGGSVRVVSKVGEGSTFYVVLPTGTSG